MVRKTERPGVVLSKRTLKRIQNLEGICGFDMENAAASVEYRFETVSGILDKKRSRNGAPAISAETLLLFSYGLEMIPKEFKVDFRIVIGDYEGYDPETVQTALLKAVAARKDRRQATVRTARERMSAFILMGIVLLLVAILNAKFKWFASSGIAFSAVIAMILELAFELHFEEGIVYFTVKRFYEKLERTDRSRIGSIRVG